MDMPTVAFCIEQVSFSYSSRGGEERNIFDGLETSILSGCVTAIMGPSGSGKSTLGKLLAGELIPQNGRVTFGTGLELESNRFYLDQDPSHVYFPWRTVVGNLRQPLGLMGWEEGEIVRRVDELLDEMDLRSVADRFPAFLSGGQKSRLALARVLSWYPRAVILDEYLADLDIITRRRVVQALRCYVHKHEMTLVMISHDPSDVASLADRCLVLGGSPGRVLAEIDCTSDRSAGGQTTFQELIHQSLIAQETVV